MKNKVYIILVNYKSVVDTLECIKSINDNEKDLDYEIIVVDNNSQDNSVEKLKQCNNIKLIELTENGGFAVGNNVGIKYALENGAEYILLLNNDTVIKRNAISILLDQMQKDKNLGIVGSRIMYYDKPDIINYCGGDIDWLKAIPIHNNYKEVFKGQYSKFEYTNFITGCCMLIRRDVFEKVGYLPEEYFMYYEDVDFCVRVKLNGFKLGIRTDSVIYHKVSASSGGEESEFSVQWGTRNRLLFINKYKEKTKGVCTILYYYITRTIKILLYNLKAKKKLACAIKRGIKEARKIINCKN